MTEVMNQLNSNQRLMRSHPKSSKSQSNAVATVPPPPPNTFPTNPNLTPRFMADPQGLSSDMVPSSPYSPSLLDSTANFLSSTAYPFVNPELANYAADAFVYSQLSDLNNRSDLATNYASATRMHPYARQSFYPMYNQREIHSPSRTRTDYSWRGSMNGQWTLIELKFSFFFICDISVRSLLASFLFFFLNSFNFSFSLSLITSFTYHH